MFTTTSHPHLDDPDRTVIVATTARRGLSRYAWTWNGGTQIAVADRAADTPFDTIGAYDHETGRRLVDDADSLIAFLDQRYADRGEIDALDATWQASLY